MVAEAKQADAPDFGDGDLYQVFRIAFDAATVESRAGVAGDIDFAAVAQS